MLIFKPSREEGLRDEQVVHKFTGKVGFNPFAKNDSREYACPHDGQSVVRVITKTYEDDNGNTYIEYYWKHIGPYVECPYRSAPAFISQFTNWIVDSALESTSVLAKNHKVWRLLAVELSKRPVSAVPLLQQFGEVLKWKLKKKTVLPTDMFDEHLEHQYKVFSFISQKDED